MPVGTLLTAGAKALFISLRGSEQSRALTRLPSAREQLQPEEHLVPVR
jgi:hypothetical protein